MSSSLLDPDDVEIINWVRVNKLSMVSEARLVNTALSCKYVLDMDIAGDFVECGVWRGGNAMIAASIFTRNSADRSIWLFDTFAGMTPPSDSDFESATRRPAIEEFEENKKWRRNYWCYANLSTVKRNFRKKAIPTGSVHFIKGDVQETLRSETQLPKKISVLRLDTDWYESTLLELEILYPRVSIGGILIIDDYGHWEGARQAVDEYLTKEGISNQLQTIDYTGRFLIKSR